MALDAPPQTPYFVRWISAGVYLLLQLIGPSRDTGRADPEAQPRNLLNRPPASVTAATLLIENCSGTTTGSRPASSSRGTALGL